MLSLVTVAVGDASKESDRVVGDMLLQDRVLVSPDITHAGAHNTHTRPNKHTQCVCYYTETYIAVTSTSNISLSHTPTVTYVKGRIEAGDRQELDPTITTQSFFLRFEEFEEHPYVSKWFDFCYDSLCTQQSCTCSTARHEKRTVSLNNWRQVSTSDKLHSHYFLKICIFMVFFEGLTEQIYLKLRPEEERHQYAEEEMVLYRQIRKLNSSKQKNLQDWWNHHVTPITPYHECNGTVQHKTTALPHFAKEAWPTVHLLPFLKVSMSKNTAQVKMGRIIVELLQFNTIFFIGTASRTSSNKSCSFKKSKWICRWGQEISPAGIKSW